MSSLSYRRLRPPEADGTALIDPPLASVPAIVAANRIAARVRDGQLGMRRGYCADARQRMLEAGAAPNPNGALPTLILTGHQPTLFHPGVWLKNFLASSIARLVDGAAVNLVVDSDTLRVPGIRVPTGGGDDARVADVLFDSPGDEVPWEVRRLVDPQLFASFPRRVHQTLPPPPSAIRGNQALLLDRIWPLAVEQSERQRADAERKLRDICKNLAIPDESFHSVAQHSKWLGWSLAAARRELERQVGLTLQQSLLSELTFWFDFGYFAEMLISRCAEFQVAHNAALAEYRTLNHIRSRAHPVPELARDGEWVEVPLWMWSRGNPRRRRVFARRTGGVWELTDREATTLRPPTEQHTDRWPAFLYVTLREGVTLRPRALITTMYARLVLSDLFIHGIGGAKYDELTDEIIRRFFGIEPPRYLTATATFRLPIDRPNVTIDDVRNAARLVRDVRYRPETLVGHPLVASDAGLERELQSLAAQKREYVRSHTLRRASHDVFDGLDRMNASMHEKLQPLQRHLRAEHARLVEQLKQSRTLGSREFSFVLYPEDYLVPRLLALAAAEK